jgi:predicted ester cyclase
MSSEQQKALVLRFWKAFEADDQAALNDLLAADFVARTPGAPEPQSREWHLQGIRGFNSAFSNRDFTVEEMVVDDDVVATRTVMRGVHTGEWQGHAPTGKPIEAIGLTIERVRDGKLVERWFSFDVARVMQELGLVTPQAN